MRGDQLAREQGIFRAIEASPNGLTFSEIANRDGARAPYRREASQKPVPKTGMGFFAMGREPKPIDCLILF